MKNERFNLPIILFGKLGVFVILSIFMMPLATAFATETVADASTGASSIISSAEINALPVSHTTVIGDIDQYRAHNWRQEGYNGGVEHFEMSGGDKDSGLSFEVEGRAIIRENDFEGSVLIEKEGVGFIHFDYEEFRKYYSTHGGVYHLFEYDAPVLDRELYLNIGKFGIEVGLTPEDLPHISFLYEREYLDGAKSRLTWGEWEENGITRNITPSWQEIEERVDIFEIKESYTIAGVDLEGEQHWEHVKIKSRRWEFDSNPGPGAGAGDNKIRIHDQEPETQLFTNTFKADRWFADNSVYSSFGYHYVHLDNEEDESIGEFTNALTAFNFGFSHNEPMNYSYIEMDQHSLATSFMVKPFESLQVIAGLKGDVVHRAGNSLANADNAGGAPDGIIDETFQSDTDNTTKKLGESLAIRFNAIPRTALYTEAELEQVEEYVSENRLNANAPGGAGGASAADSFQRETVADITRGSWTIGHHTAPLRFVNITNQFRYKRANSDYDHDIETVPGSTAFYDSIKYQTAEFNSTIRVRPFSWMSTAFRYTVQDTDFFTRYDSQNEVKVAQNSDSLTFDVTLMPIPELFVSASFTRATSSVVNAISRDNPTISIPGFNSDVNTWMANFDYTPLENVSVFGSLYFAHASNHDDQSPTALSYGAAYDKFGLSGGVKVALCENASVELNYGVQTYDPDSRFSPADYTAHTVGGKLSAAFG